MERVFLSKWDTTPRSAHERHRPVPAHPVPSVLTFFSSPFTLHFSYLFFLCSFFFVFSYISLHFYSLLFNITSFFGLFSLSSPPCSALFLSFSSFLFPFLLLLLLLISPLCLIISPRFSLISLLSSTRFISFFFHFLLFVLFFFLFSLPHLSSSFFFYSIFLIPPCLALSLLSLFLFPSVCLFCSCPFPPFFVFTPPLLFFLTCLYLVLKSGWWTETLSFVSRRPPSRVPAAQYLHLLDMTRYGTLLLPGLVPKPVENQ